MSETTGQRTAYEKKKATKRARLWAISECERWYNDKMNKKKWLKYAYILSHCGIVIDDCQLNTCLLPCKLDYVIYVVFCGILFAVSARSI